MSSTTTVQAMISGDPTRSKPRGALLTSSEVDFFAEDELVTIVPKFESDTIKLITGDYGPFLPQTPVQVPLWLAVALKKQGKCALQCPEWLTVANLQAMKRREKELDMNAMASMPFHYMEIASAVLRHGQDDITDVHKVRSLLEDIQNVRQHKLRHGLQEFARNAGSREITHLRMTQASALEINTVRPILFTALHTFSKLRDLSVSAQAHQRELFEAMEAQEEAEAEEQEQFGMNNNNTDRFGVVSNRNRRVAQPQQPSQQSSSYDSDDDAYGLVHANEEDNQHDIFNDDD